MATVAAVAINLAVMRSIEQSFEQSDAGGMSHFFFACGVMPMATLLILIALISAPSLVCGGRLSPFILGFEVFGWAVLLVFVACYSVDPSVLVAYAEPIDAYTRPCAYALRHRFDLPRICARGWDRHLFTTAVALCHARRLAEPQGWDYVPLRAPAP